MKLTFPVLIAGAAIALGLGLVAYNNQNPTKQEDITPLAGDNSIDVKNQRAGSIVAVDAANLQKNGFIAIRETNGSRLGKVIGTSPLLAPGENRSIFISANLVSGKDYYAVLYEDDGDAKFNESGDEISENVSGEEVKTKFTVL